MDPGTPVNSPAHFGYTRTGHPVHRTTTDHLPGHSTYARFNKKVAVAITRWVGSMSCAWFFCLLALLSLPAVLTQAFHVTWFPRWLVAVGLIALVAWIAQTFLQLVLLSVIMVGQNVSQAASDARAEKTFADAELITDRLDTATEGGLTDVLTRVNTLTGQVSDLAETIRTVMAARAEHDSGVAADVKAARTAAESAFVATQALAAIATTPPPGRSGGTAGPKPGAAR
jgi:hypothetical protein